MKIKDYDEAQEIITLFDNSGYTENPMIRTICEFTKATGNLTELERMLFRYPYLINQAKRAIYDDARKASKQPYHPLPTLEEMPTISGLFKLGYVNQHGGIAGLDPLDLTRGVTIVGEPGSGKSYATLSLIGQALSIPRDERDFNILIIQVVKNDADYLIKYHPDLRIINWPDLRYNMFQTESWDSTSERINYAASVFSSGNYLMNVSQPILRRSLKTLVQNGQQPTFTKLWGVIHKVIDQLAGDKSYEMKNTKSRILARYADYIDRGPILNCEYGFPIKQFWTKKDIILNVMQESSDYVYATVITDILMQIQRYHEKTSIPGEPARLKTLIVIDECLSVFPIKHGMHDHDPDRLLERFVTSARACGVGRLFVTQQPQDISPYIPNNSAYFLVFPIAGDALKSIQIYQNLTDEQLDYIFKLPSYGTGIFRDRRFDRPYLIAVPPLIQPDHISRAEVDAFMKTDIEKFHSMCVVKKKPATEIGASQEQKGAKVKNYDVYRAIVKDPYLNLSKLAESVDVSLTSRFEEMANECIKESFIERVRFKTGRGGRQPKFYVLTEKGIDLLGIKKKETRAEFPTAKAFKHKYFIEMIRRNLQAKGIQPQKEYNNGKGKGRVDLYAHINGMHTAFEVILTDPYYIHETVDKVFNVMKLDRLCIVRVTKAELDKIRKEVQQSTKITDEQKERISFKQTKELI